MNTGFEQFVREQQYLLNISPRCSRERGRRTELPVVSCSVAPSLLHTGNIPPYEHQDSSEMFEERRIGFRSDVYIGKTLPIRGRERITDPPVRVFQNEVSMAVHVHFK